MTDPLSALGMTAFAFLNSFLQTEQGKKFIESIVGKLGEKLTEAGLGKVGELKRKIVAKLSGNPKAAEAIAQAERGDEEALRDVEYHLRTAMREDPEFASEIKQIAEQIINIGNIEGKNVQNNYGGENFQVNDPNAPTIQGGTNNTITFNYGKD